MDIPLPALSAEAEALKLGMYKHYKGKQCRVVGVCRHSETLEEMVMYQELNDDISWWVRPVTMFIENVEADGQLQPRFRFLHA